MKKKIISLIIVIFTVFLTIQQVNAARYEYKELAPIDKTITITGDTFLYKDISIKNNEIKIDKIKNISTESHAISISIAFFNEEKDNIGLINHCAKERTLDPEQEILSYIIPIEKGNLGELNTIKDIKYVSVISENKVCRIDGSREYIGKKVEDINKIETSDLTPATDMLITMLKFIGVGIIVLFVYKFAFTSAYVDMDGDDTRSLFKTRTRINKKKNKKNKNKLIPESEGPIKNTEKSEDIIEQEEKENSNKDNSDLHNFYK